MRLFIAVNFTDEIKSRILEIQERLRAQVSRGSFPRPENFHITLAFLGETPDDKLKSLFKILEGIQSPVFDLSFSRTGCFTHSGKELWWIGTAPDCPGLPLLKAIHGQLSSRLEKEGFPFDRRPFNAHITLAREVKHTRPIVLECPEIKVRVERISLMKSDFSVGKRIYTELKAREL